MALHHPSARHFLDSTCNVLAFESFAFRNVSPFFPGSRTRSFFFFEGFEEGLDPRWVSKLPDNPTCLDRILHPFYSCRAWLRLLSDNFDWRFILMVVFGQHCLKGLLSGGGSQGLLAVEGLIYMRLHVGASLKTVYQAIGSSAWGLKPLYALISDLLPLGGYRRSPWIIISSIFATCAYLTLVLDGTRLTGVLVCACFFCAKLQMAWTDLMVEATYTEKMRDTPRFAADIVSFAWSGIGLFGLIGLVIAGPGIDLVGPILVLTIAIPFSSFIILPTSAGWLTERRLSRAERSEWMARMRDQWNYCLCTLILTVGVLVTIASGLLHADSAQRALVAAAVSAVTGIASVLLLPPSIWKPLMFMFVSNSLTVATGGFVDNFYLDPATHRASLETGYPVCEDCPHFSATFYYTVMGVADSLFMLVGSYIFSRYMAHWTYRRALAVSTVVLVMTGFLDIVQYQRWNVALGLPDWFFMLGKSSVQNTVGMINFMPTTILMSKVCPPGLEASVFALLAGFSNFGNTIAGFLGAYALTLLGMDDIGRGRIDDFSNAWMACVMSALSTPLSLLFLPWWIPDAKMNQDLPRDPDDNGDEGIRLLTNGSNLFAGLP